MSSFVVGYGLLSILSALFWKLGGSFCLIGQCGQDVVTVFGRSLFLWGALFYASISLFLSLSKYRQAVTYYIGAGVIGHWLLTFIGFLMLDYFCTYCLILLIANSFLFFLLLKDEENCSNTNLKSLVPFVLTVGLFLVLILNPVNKIDLDSPVLSVLDSQENEVELNLKDRPVFIFTEWCGNCDLGLMYISHLPEEKRPYLVSVLNNDVDYKEKTELKLEKWGLDTANYYIFNDYPRENGFPVLLEWKESQIVTIKNPYEI